MTMPWLASASPTKFLHNLQSPNSQSTNSNPLAPETQNVRSAIDSRFNTKPKTPTSQSPHNEPRQGQLNIHRPPPPPRHHGGRRQYPNVPRTADPRLGQFPQPKENMYYSISERRVVNMEDAPRPRYDPSAGRRQYPRAQKPSPQSQWPKEKTPTSPYPSKAPDSGRHHEPRTPKSSSPSHWPNEKTPTSPYHPRQPPSNRGPPSGGFRQPAPYTAHPLGSFPRHDPRDEYYRSRPYNDGSLSATPELRANGNKRAGFLDFGKVKFAFRSPLSASKTDQSHSPSPKLPTPDYRPRDTRRQGFYQFQTPHASEFERTRREGPKSAGVIFDESHYPRSPYDIERSRDHPGTVAPAPEVQKYEPEGATKQKGGSRIFGIWQARFHKLLRNPFQPFNPRIPSVQADAEPQTLEEIERRFHDNTIISWTTVAGAWLIQFTTFGYIWSWGVFQDYYMHKYPKVHTVGGLSCIGSLQLALCFALGIVSGKFLDAGWFSFVTMLGSLIFGISVFILSFVDPSKYFPLFFVQGVLMGTGLGLVFLPSATVCMHHFKEKKAMITGIVMSGSCFGAMIYPIMLNRLLEPKGFQGAVRATSYMVVALLVIANCLVSKPPKQWSPKFPSIDVVSYLKERHYAFICGGIFVTTLALWFPQSYIEEYAVHHGVNPVASFYSIAVIGVAGVMGRIAMGIAAEKVGPWNLLIPTGVVVLAMISAMSTLKTVGSVVIISMIYGFASGAWLSLLITALASLANRPGEIGHRVGVALSVGSFGAFLSGPIHAGLVSTNWAWSRSIVVVALFTMASIGLFVYVRILVAAKRRFRWV